MSGIRDFVNHHVQIVDAGFLLGAEGPFLFFLSRDKGIPEAKEPSDRP